MFASASASFASEDTRKCVVSASRLARDFGDKILTLEVGISMCDRELSRFGEVLDKMESDVLARSRRRDLD